MEVIKENPMDVVRSMKPSDIAYVGFNSFGKYRGFTTLLSYYNSDDGAKNDIYVHCSSCRRKLTYCLVATTATENDEELADSNLKGRWKELLPEEWLTFKDERLP